MQKSDPIRVAIVDDDVKVREVIEWLVQHSEEFEFAGAFSNAEEAMDEIEEASPDIVLMDINMPVMSGIECVERLNVDYPELKILMLTNYSDDARIFAALRAGAVGYLLKNSSTAKLAEAIKEAFHGGAPMSGEVAQKVIAYFHNQKKGSKYTAMLSDREQEVLQALSDGLANKEIAAKLFISVPTVRFHLKNIYAKLHVNSRTEAVLKAIQGGLA
jgi:DNA-binding NarL/FixJ family response regulator